MGGINAYEACKILRVGLNDLNEIVLLFELHDRKEKIDVKYAKFERDKIISIYFLRCGERSLVPMSKIPLIFDYKFYCPSCERYFDMPPYFLTHKSNPGRGKLEGFDDRLYWLCSMITHCRHRHFNYDETINNEDEDYDDEEIVRIRDEFNRKIIEYLKTTEDSSIKDYIKEHNIDEETFLKLKSQRQPYLD
ncbi:MAG: hypothetical protein AB2L20_30105 [Mangrovibacterium sp.]